ncbi:hypothetical protein Pla110_16350 [Polystyrenella longa]|uniref:Permuted papain-like amidase enzyme, YaeF/YiiX, C92 family n=1 Tax=Polystyrenella longa TaxID=2528007 RepID=A0A518CL06_9PLAN|nr:YiiX/YebB-like N1pC/P60 family cysteine hydrolase [Polystyrenella longa]QDU79915.1 hypothetical protein Pla110_16350 [Polystyrenella longa]
MNPIIKTLFVCLSLVLYGHSLIAAEAKPAKPVPAGIESDNIEADCSCVGVGTEENSPDYIEIFSTPEEAVTSIAPELQTGSLIFTKGDCLAVRMYTRSNYTHVAAVVKEPTGEYVYDSMNPMGVRRLSLSEYLSTQLPDELHLLHPQAKLTSNQEKAFTDALEAKIGTPYSVRHHLTGNRAEGVHCAEYVIDALNECDLMRAENPPRVSPASLLRGSIGAGLYQPVRSFAIQPPLAPVEVANSWCEQLWVDTCDCTSYSWIRFRKLVFCH